MDKISERKNKKMGKLDALMEGRLQGMEFALRLVKDQGIEALEKEIRYRSRKKICLNVTTAELSAASNKIKEQTLDTFTILGIAALHDLFGFGEKKMPAVHGQDGRRCKIPGRRPCNLG